MQGSSLWNFAHSFVKYVPFRCTKTVWIFHQNTIFHTYSIDPMSIHTPPSMWGVHTKWNKMNKWRSAPGIILYHYNSDTNALSWPVFLSVLNALPQFARPQSLIGYGSRCDKLDQAETRSLLMCFLHIMKTISEGKKQHPHGDFTQSRVRVVNALSVYICQISVEYCKNNVVVELFSSFFTFLTCTKAMVRVQHRAVC